MKKNEMTKKLMEEFNEDFIDVVFRVLMSGRNL